MTTADAKRALEALRKRLHCETLDGKAYWFATSKKRSARDPAPTAHLLSIYDEYVSGYKDRSAIVNARNGPGSWPWGMH